jgi:transposase-like protein
MRAYRNAAAMSLASTVVRSALIFSGKGRVADQLRPKVPKLAALTDDAEADVLAFMTFPKDHRPKIHSLNPLERLSGEIKRRTDVVGIFPNEDTITRLVSALLLEQNDANAELAKSRKPKIAASTRTRHM